MASSKQVQTTQRRKKLHAVEAFGGKCQVCGYNKCPNALEFHHISGKAESPSYVIMRWSWEKAKKELEKCILLCANCHREAHYMDVNLDFSKYLLPFVSRQCPRCDKIFETKNENQKFCCTLCSYLASRKVERPSKDDLTELLAFMTWVDIGKKFGVSDNAVRKWARKYQIIGQ